MDRKGRGGTDPCEEANDDPGTLAWTRTHGMDEMEHYI
jgi:hypothetical protein